MKSELELNKMGLQEMSSKETVSTTGGVSPLFFLVAGPLILTLPQPVPQPETTTEVKK